MRNNFYLKYISEETFQKFDEEVKTKLLDNEKLIAWLEAKQLEYFNNKCYKDGITCLLCDAMLESKMLITKNTKNNKNKLEILELKEMLEKAKIPFSFTDAMYGNYEKPSYQIIIYSKRDKKVRLCDAIYHFGSYGFEQNLLEIKGGLTSEENEDDSVLGYLKADEVFKRFKYCYEHNTDIYLEE